MVQTLTAGHEREDLENGFRDTDEATFLKSFLTSGPLVLEEPRPGRNQAEVSGLGFEVAPQRQSFSGEKKSPSVEPESGLNYR